MFDPQIIKDRYASMYDEELIQIAKTDGADLTVDALIFLKEELRRRNIRQEIIITEKENRYSIENDTEKEIIPQIDHDILGSGLTYQKLMYDKITEEPSATTAEEVLTSEQIKEGLAKSLSAMRFYGLIFIAGLVVTIGSVIAAKEGGNFVLAWGALLFGGIKFITSFIKWNKFKSIQAGMNVINGEKENEAH